MAVNMGTHTAFAGVSVLLYIVHMLHICCGYRSCDAGQTVSSYKNKYNYAVTCRPFHTKVQKNAHAVKLSGGLRHIYSVLFFILVTLRDVCFLSVKARMLK